ncbi:MAG TPA: HD domain-containing phosphohydrolase [Bryobacteraceae bacterium]|jgi:putative nucleotidyltransferase with HDIG domain
MRIAAELKLPRQLRNSLYYGLLLKDAGWSGNAVNKQQRKEVMAMRCERGGTLARLMGLPEETAASIAANAERWNGHGNPCGLAGDDIPITSRIILAAQTLDLFYSCFGREPALRVVVENSSFWFDPAVVKAVQSLEKRAKLWAGFERGDLLQNVLRLEPNPRMLSDGDVTLDAICQAFATIVDAKSPFTCSHSNGVANAAVVMARRLGLENSQILFVRHAALLHDIGKMAVPNAILQKPGPLDAAEWKTIHSHPVHTWRILSSIRGFEKMSEVAGSHHERLNGSGYFRGLTADQIQIETRVLMVADVFDALLTNRPYRPALPIEKVFEKLKNSSPQEFDPACVRALEQSGIERDQSFKDIYTLREQLANTAARSR